MHGAKSFSLSALFAAFVLVSGTVTGSPVPVDRASVTVECARGSGLIQLNIENHRKIGNVLIEVRDAKGQLLYREEGKAMTGELVRRLDKGMFPIGSATVTVETRDFKISQVFEIK